MNVIKTLISPFVGERLNKILNSVCDVITDEISQIVNNKILEYLCTEYERNYKTKTILHRSEPIKLEDFYQPLFLQKQSNQWGHTKLPIESNRICTEKVESLFDDSDCITIIGTAGSGKSTLVKYLFVNTITENYKIPIKIELRYLNNYSGDLISYIKNEIIKFAEIAQSDRIIERLLSSGDFIIFFDGYDELALNKKENVTRDICNITKKYKKNKYILTSRPLVNIDMLEHFHNYQVCEMNLDEITLFVKKQFSQTEQELADKIIATIKNEDSKIYHSFLSNPLLLSMFIITYQSDSNVPQKRSDYYYQVFNTLYSVHDTSSKLGFVRDRKTKLLKENFIDLLKRFSFKAFLSQKYAFSEEYFSTEMQNIKTDLNLTFSNDDLLFDLEVSIGILTQDGLDITYPHRSLQEYFAALFVTSLTHENKLKIYQHLQTRCESSFGTFVVYDYLNFYSLLSEMDQTNFIKYFFIPILKSSKQKVCNLKNSDSIVNAFMSICAISYLCSKEMRLDFSNYITDTYDKKLNKARRTKQAHNKIIETSMLPFLRNYDYDKIIVKIENDIKSSEAMDSTFIDNLF